MKYITSIVVKLKDLEGKEDVKPLRIKIFGSVLVALSGFILFADKVITLKLSNNYGFADTQTFIWALSQSLSPFILVIALLFKPFKTSFLVPLYMYFIQIYWVFNACTTFDDFLMQAYAIGTCIIYIILIYIIKRYKIFRDKLFEENRIFHDEAKKTMDVLRNRILK